MSQGLGGGVGWSGVEEVTGDALWEGGGAGWSGDCLREGGLGGQLARGVGGGCWWWWDERCVGFVWGGRDGAREGELMGG